MTSTETSAGTSTTTAGPCRTVEVLGTDGTDGGYGRDGGEGYAEAGGSRRRAALVAGVAAFAVLLATGAGTPRTRRWRAAAATPTTCSPPRRSAMAEVDLDPSAGQKLDAVPAAAEVSRGRRAAGHRQGLRRARAGRRLASADDTAARSASTSQPTSSPGWASGSRSAAVPADGPAKVGVVVGAAGDGRGRRDSRDAQAGERRRRGAAGLGQRLHGRLPVVSPGVVDHGCADRLARGGGRALSAERTTSRSDVAGARRRPGRDGVGRRGQGRCARRAGDERARRAHRRVRPRPGSTRVLGVAGWASAPMSPTGRSRSSPRPPAPGPRRLAYRRCPWTRCVPDAWAVLGLSGADKQLAGGRVRTATASPLLSALAGRADALGAAAARRPGRALRLPADRVARRRPHRQAVGARGVPLRRPGPRKDRPATTCSPRVDRGAPRRCPPR